VSGFDWEGGDALRPYISVLIFCPSDILGNYVQITQLRTFGKIIKLKKNFYKFIFFLLQIFKDEATDRTEKLIV
jgi:hypothetical protein